jgi:hypothetical protein
MPFGTTPVRVAVEDHRHRKAADRIFETARADERIDFRWLSFNRLLNGRVVEQDDLMLGPQPGQRGFELERFVDRLVREVLDRRLAPWSERALAEPAAESFDARDTDTANSRARIRASSGRPVSVRSPARSSMSADSDT